MKKGFLSCLLLLSFLCTTRAQEKLPTAAKGSIDRIENLKSQYVTSRNIDIWLPEGFSKDKKYAVLYMHDGQMLYDSEVTWNKQSWEVDEVAQELIDAKKVQDFIVVGIWNGGSTRHADYYPNKPFQKLSTKDLNEIKKQPKSAHFNHNPIYLILYGRV